MSDFDLDFDLAQALAKAGNFLAGYAAAIDRADVAAVVQHYAEDGGVEHDDGTAASGADQLRDWFAGRVDPAVFTQHAVSNLAARPGEDGLVHFDCCARTIRCQDADSMLLVGRYEVDAREYGDDLRVVRMRIHVDRRIQLQTQ